MELDLARVSQSLIEMWRAGGMDTLVKVMPATLAPDTNRSIGYCTTFKYIAGRTPLQMERTIGLRDNSKLDKGAAVYAVRPLPQPGQFSLRGYSQTPAGIPTDVQPAHPDYPPGLGVPQWELTGCYQRNLVLLAYVPPGQPFRYMASTLGPVT